MEHALRAKRGADGSSAPEAKKMKREIFSLPSVTWEQLSSLPHHLVYDLVMQTLISLPDELPSDKAKVRIFHSVFILR